MNYSEHDDYPVILDTVNRIRGIVPRFQSRLGDVIHYASHGRWDDAKWCLGEIGDVERRLCGMVKQGADAD